jgi:Bacterial capsule synthesis protein PGA_cap
MSRFNLLLFILLCSVTLAFASFSLVQLRIAASTVEAARLESSRVVDVTTVSIPEISSIRSGPIIFTGDILLARHVEFLMERNGTEYPFVHLRPLFASSTAVIANFESSIPATHAPTPNGKMVFSTKAEYASLLHQVGVTHVSLANNHATDFGEAAYQNTVTTFEATSIDPFGHPRTLSTTSVTYVTYEDKTVGVIAIHTLFTPPTKSQLESLVRDMTAASDIQIAYMHWGNEYEIRHGLAQQALAETLVDFGIDAIVGHHPHVTQDIQLINSVPVFYSLGNLIFDQYFSGEVQQGYLLSLTISDTELAFTLVPVTSLGTRAQPRLMNQSENNVFLHSLALRSDVILSESIKQGKVIVPISLATSTKNSIISP